MNANGPGEVADYSRYGAPSTEEEPVELFRLYHPIEPHPEWVKRFAKRETADQFLARRQREAEKLEKAVAATGSVTVSYLDAGMKSWLRRARQRWLEHGGYGVASRAQQAELRALGIEPAPRAFPWPEHDAPDEEWEAWRATCRSAAVSDAATPSSPAQAPPAPAPAGPAAESRSPSSTSADPAPTRSPSAAPSSSTAPSTGASQTSQAPMPARATAAASASPSSPAPAPPEAKATYRPPAAAPTKPEPAPPAPRASETGPAPRRPATRSAGGTKPAAPRTRPASPRSLQTALPLPPQLPPGKRPAPKRR